MIKSRIAFAGVLLAAAGAANAGSFSVTPTIVSDYDWRGWTQSDKDPAVQLGLDYAFDSGFYVGTWASTVDFGPGDPNVEVDLYAGYAWGDSETSFGYDFGVNYYAYPGDSDGNFFEAYAGIAKGVFDAKLWYSPKFLGDYGDESAFYVEANGKFPLPENFSILTHIGYSFGDYHTGNKYTDYSVGLGYDVSNFALSLKYVDGSNGVDNRVIGAISTTLPW